MATDDKYDRREQAKCRLFLGSFFLRQDHLSGHVVDDSIRTFVLRVRRTGVDLRSRVSRRVDGFDDSINKFGRAAEPSLVQAFVGDAKLPGSIDDPAAPRDGDRGSQLGVNGFRRT